MPYGKGPKGEMINIGNTFADVVSDLADGKLDGAAGAPAKTSGGGGNGYVQAASKAFVPFGWNMVSPPAGEEAVTFKIQHVANMTFGAPRLHYGNWHHSDLSTNDIIVKAAIENANGNILPVTFRGASQITLKPGENILSDPVGIGFAQDEAFWTRTYVKVNATERYPNTTNVVNGASEGWGFSDLTGGGAMPIVGEKGCYSPFGIFGTPLSRDFTSTFFMGDSLTGGSVGYGFYPGNGFAALSGQTHKRSVVVTGRNGQFASDATNISVEHRRFAMAQYCTHAVILWLTNDLAGASSVTLQQAKNILLFHWNYVNKMGLKVYGVTIPPRCLGSVNAQTPDTLFGVGGVRSQLNDWIRSLPAPLTGFFDLAALWGTGTEYSLWKTEYWEDGTHSNFTGNQAAAQLIDLTKFS